MQWTVKIAVLALTATLLLSGLTPLAAQEKTRTLVLEHADSTVLLSTDESTDYILIGNVLFSHGEDRLSCDRAAWLRSAGKIICSGNVMLTQPHRFLHADSIVYDRAEQTALALGKAVLVDSTERTRIEGERMIFYRGLDFGVCDSFPRMIMDFDDSTARTEIISERLEYDRTQRRGWAKDSVVVRRAQWVATCGIAETRPDSGVVILTEDPLGWGNNAQASGDSIILYSVNRYLERVRVIGDAQAVYHPAGDSILSDTVEYEGEKNWIWAKEIVFALADNRLTRIDAWGAARTKYVPRAADSTAGELRGENHSSGDTLTLYLQENEVERAVIRGGGRGTYFNPVGPNTEAVDTILYFGDKIDFLPDSSRIYLFGQGKINYGTIELTADQIRYDTQKKTLSAAGRPHPDSAGLFIGLPILRDGTQTVYGEKLRYNVNTGRGMIRGSLTEHEKAYYRGDDFYKYTDREFFVEGGIYSTCDHDPPHYSFRGKTMKIIRGDKVISRPVVLYLDQMPVLAIPYYIFPIKPGRHSGFLSMHIGNFEQGQRFVDNIGYYWAASQYWDLETAINIREEPGIQFRSTVRYALRYTLGGSVSGTYAPESYWKTNVDPPMREKRTRWSLAGSHWHNITPTLRVSGSANFISDKSYYTDFSYDPEERRNRSLRSKIHINKRWKGASLYAFLESVDNLDTDQQTRRLPGITFTLMPRKLVPAPVGADTENSWYHSISYSYSTRLSHDIFKYANSKKRYATIDHQASVSAPQKLFEYITVSPRASGRETWYYVFNTDQAQEEGVLIEKPARRGSFSLGVSANSNLYGFLYPRIFGLETLRHTLSPRIGYSFSPAVTKHDGLRKYTAKGGGSSRSAQTLSVRLGQNLDAKIIRDGKEEKVALLSGSISASYNFEAEKTKWSNLSSSVSTRLARRISLSVSAVHDFYDPVTLNLRWTNPRLKTFSISTATSLRGGASAFAASSQWDEPDTLTTGGLPFNASISYRYSESRSLARTTKRHWISGTLQISPTPKWRVKFATNYDLVGHRTSDQSFEFYRDLHCWEGRFVWVPGGGRKGYYFKVNVKAIPDVKIEKSESGIRGTFFR